MKTLEERIINLKKVKDGEERIEPAELRQLVMSDSDTPKYIKVVPARMFAVQFDMTWNSNLRQFTAEYDGANWSVQFDYKDFLPQPWTAGKITKSPRSGRASTL